MLRSTWAPPAAARDASNCNQHRASTGHDASRDSPLEFQHRLLPLPRWRQRRARTRWLDAYVSTYLERDLAMLGFRLPPTRMRNLWTMLTHVHGSRLNVSDLARSLGVNPHVVADNRDVLEGTFMVRRLTPHFANVQKRLTKSPKVYVRDTGLLHFLAGLRTPASLTTWPMRGHSFEGLVIEGMATRAEFVVPQGPEQRSLARDIEIVPWNLVASGAFDFGLSG